MNEAIDPRGGNDAQPQLCWERDFGLVFAAVFAIIAVWPLLRADKMRLWSLGIAVVFLAAALMAPRALAPLNRLWFRIGILLDKVVTPLVMGVFWFVVVTPVEFLMRLFSEDSPRLKRELTAKSYSIKRPPPGPVAGSLKDQF